MKIAIPVDDKSMDTTVCQSFGRTPYFLIYDTEDRKSEFLDNGAVASQGGAGIKAAQSIVDHKARALLTPRCGKNAAEVLEAANIKIYKTTYSSVQENIEAFSDGMLTILQDIHPGFHGHGGN